MFVIEVVRPEGFMSAKFRIFRGMCAGACHCSCLIIDRVRHTECRGNGVCCDTVCMWGSVIVAPGRTVKGYCSFTLRMIDDRNGAFFMFASELGAQREVPRLIERPLILRDDFLEKEDRSVSRTIITIGLYDKDQVSCCRADVL